MLAAGYSHPQANLTWSISVKLATDVNLQIIRAHLLNIDNTLSELREIGLSFEL